MKIQIKQGILSHSRVLVIESKGEVFAFRATNHIDRFPEEMIDSLRRVINEMQDHNSSMRIRDEERK